MGVTTQQRTVNTDPQACFWGAFAYSHPLFLGTISSYAGTWEQRTYLPSRQVRVGICLDKPIIKPIIIKSNHYVEGDARIDIVVRRVAWWVAANVDALGMLIHADIVNQHLRREDQVVKVDRAEV